MAKNVLLSTAFIKAVRYGGKDQLWRHNDSSNKKTPKGLSTGSLPYQELKTQVSDIPDQIKIMLGRIRHGYKKPGSV